MDIYKRNATFVRQIPILQIAIEAVSIKKDTQALRPECLSANQPYSAFISVPSLNTTVTSVLLFTTSFSKIIKLLRFLIHELYKKKAYNLHNMLQDYDCSQEYYEKEKESFIKAYSDYPITLLDCSGMSEEERIAHRNEKLKAEWETELKKRSLKIKT